MPSRNTYRLTWVYLTLDVGYLFTAALTKCSHCSLPWMKGYLLMATPPDLECGVAPLGCSCARTAAAPWTWGCCTCIFLNCSIVWIYTQEWICWIIWQVYFYFFWGISLLFSIVAAPTCIPTNSVGGVPKRSNFSTHPSNTLLLHFRCYSWLASHWLQCCNIIFHRQQRKI